jgi:DNA-binding LacI/PurR family transcriptional regulator
MQETVSKKPVSMKDVAEYLGVSKATVSRALSGKTEISAAMRQKINKACEQLGYRLNPNIQDLVLKSRSGVTRNIGYVLVERDFSDPAYASMMDGIAEGIKKIQYNLVLVKLTGEERNIYDLPPMLRDGRLDGILITGNLRPPVMNALKKLRIVTVALGAYSPAVLQGVNNVQSSLEKKSYESVELALKNGCRSIALFEETPESFSNLQIYNYIKAAAEEYGIEFRQENFFRGDGAYSGAMKVMKPVFEQPELSFDGIICWDFRTAGEVASLVMGRCGLRNEPDVKIVVSRPYPHFTLPVPALYMEENGCMIARTGVEFLLEQIKNNSEATKTIQIKV